MRKIFLILLGFFLFGAESSEQLEINYIIEKSPEGYFINISFQSTNTDKTLLSMPMKWANASTAHKGVHNLALLSSDARLMQEADDKVHVIHKPMATVNLRYQLVPVAESTLDPTKMGYTLPIFNENYIHWIGITSLVMPYLKENASEKISVTLTTKGFDDRFPFYSSLPKKNGQYQFYGKNTDFLSSIFVAGDYRIKDYATKYGQISLAIRGDWEFDDESIFQSLLKIYIYQREYWQEPENSGDLWVSLTPLDEHENPDVVQSNGIALYNSFTSFFTKNLRQENINYLFAHEGFHYWLPRKFGKLSGEPQSMSWFSEGFTDYLTYELLFNTGLINEDAYKERLEDAYRIVNSSNMKNVSNSQQAEQFFSNPLMPRAIYARGMVLAHMWDLDIKTAHANELSLRDMLISLQQEQQNRDKALTRQMLEEHASKFGASDSRIQSSYVLKETGN